MVARTQFQRIETAWQKLAVVVTYYFKLGPCVICLAFTDCILSTRLTRAFAHLEIPPTTPDLTIGVWDTAQMKQTLPPLDWAYLNQNGYLGVEETMIYFHFFHHINALSALDLKTNRGYYVVKDASQLPWWIDGSPLLILLHVFSQKAGMQVTHTGAVCNHAGALLLCGRGGSGKSTTTLSMAEAGFSYLGEDYCVLNNTHPARVYSLYQSAKWEANTCRLFPQYNRYILNPQTAMQEKALVYYQDLKLPMQTEKPILASIALSRSKVSHPVLKPVTWQTGLKHLLMSTLLQLPFGKTETIRTLKEIAMSIRHYELILSRDMKANVQQLETLLPMAVPHA